MNSRIRVLTEILWKLSIVLPAKCTELNESTSLIVRLLWEIHYDAYNNQVVRSLLQDRVKCTEQMKRLTFTHLIFLPATYCSRGHNTHCGVFKSWVCIDRNIPRISGTRQECIPRFQRT
jgi:hypothetical protein